MFMITEDWKHSIYSKRHWLNKAHPSKNCYTAIQKSIEDFQVMIWTDGQDIM